MALQDTVRFLGAIPTFADLEPAALRAIAFSAEMRILHAGHVLFRRGETSDCGFVLLSGTIALEGERGSPILVKAPVLIGEAALMTETARPVTAVAREASSLLKVSRETFCRVMADHPRSAALLRQALAERLIGLHRDLDRVDRDGSLLPDR